MDSKEKAEYLIRQMTVDFDIELHQSKLCAIVAVDEILDFITKYDNHWLDYTYWQEVKSEIEKI